FAWTVDNTTPDTTGPDSSTLAHPSDPTAQAGAEFTFSGDDGGGSGVAGFECKLDAEPDFGACASPKSYAGLADGSHTFQVRAIEIGSAACRDSASFSWTVEATNPETNP